MSSGIARPASSGQVGRKVSGVVVAAATEQPVPNARVEYREQGESAQKTVTDAKGQFTFSAGRLGVVTVTANGFGTARGRWPRRRGNKLEIALTPPVAVQGTLVDSATLEPLAGVVTALVRHPASMVSMSALVEDGTFRFEDVPSAPGVVVAYADNYAPTVSTFTTAEGDWLDGHLRLSAGAEARGQVLDAAAKPVAGARLIVRYTGALAEALMLASFVGGAPITKADGTFTLTGLVPNTPVTLYAEYGGQRTNTVAVEISPGEVRPDLVLRQP